MNEAAMSLNMTIQFSMSYTPAILQSTKMQAVTQIRGSGDYVCGGDTWRVGLTAMYYWALGAVASKDTFWTTQHQPGCPKAGSLNCTEPNTEIQIIMATLAGGPVGPGDRLGLVNRSMVMHSCNEVGLVLRPSRPITALDVAFATDSESHVESAAVPSTIWSTYNTFSLNGSSPSSGTAVHYVFYSGTNPVTITPVDLLSPCANTSIGQKRDCVDMAFGLASSEHTYFAVTVTHTGGEWAADGSQRTLRRVEATEPLKLTPPPSISRGSQPFTFEVLAPSLAGSPWVVLGELDKIATVSNDRFARLQVSNMLALNWVLTGGPGEEVHITWAKVDTLELETTTCTLDASGTGSFRCAGSRCLC